jgi:hypothetical protein
VALLVVSIIKISFPRHIGNAGRAIAEVVSRRFPTAAARARAQVRSCRICGGQSGTGFSPIISVSPILILPTASH